jgi:hypothetical protein
VLAGVFLLGHNDGTAVPAQQLAQRDSIGCVVAQLVERGGQRLLVAATADDTVGVPVGQAVLDLTITAWQVGAGLLGTALHKPDELGGQPGGASMPITTRSRGCATPQAASRSSTPNSLPSSSLSRTRLASAQSSRCPSPAHLSAAKPSWLPSQPPTSQPM